MTRNWENTRLITHEFGSGWAEVHVGEDGTVDIEVLASYLHRDEIQELIDTLQHVKPEGD